MTILFNDHDQLGDDNIGPSDDVENCGAPPKVQIVVMVMVYQVMVYRVKLYQMGIGSHSMINQWVKHKQGSCYSS